MSAVSFRYKTFRSTIVRPADTTVYTAGDIVAGASNEIFTFGTAWQELASADVDYGVARRQAETKSFSMDWLQLVSSANQATKMAGSIWFFITSPTSQADNTAFAPTDTQMEESIIAKFDFADTDWSVGNSTVGVGGNSLCDIPTRGRSFGIPDIDAGGTGQLYARLVLSNAYTPVSAERITIKFGASRD